MAVDVPTLPFGPGLVFCVGAAKAGTGWLYEYLRAHPDCHLRSVKELHYFDARDLGERAWHLKAFEARLDRLLSGTGAGPGSAAASASASGPVAGPGAPAPDDVDDLRALIALHREEAENTEAYLAYLRHGLGAARLVGDVTPAYGLLSAARLAMMSSLAPVTRFVYILRDPVARLWSHLKMIALRGAGGEDALFARVRRLFWRFGRGELAGVRARGDYAGTLQRLHAALRPGQLLVLFFEDLFTQTTAERLCAFLGIRPHPAPVALRVHRGPDLPMKERQRLHAQTWLAPQYDYVNRTLGRVPEAWRANMPEGSV